MAHFTGVSIATKANVYFDGKVTSRTVLFPDGTKKTLGIMLPGEYEFDTAEAEIMAIQAGSLDVNLPGSSEWQRIEGPAEFRVPSNSRFGLKVHSVVDYICSFIKA